MRTQAVTIMPKTWGVALTHTVKEIWGACMVTSIPPSNIGLENDFSPPKSCTLPACNTKHATLLSSAQCTTRCGTYHIPHNTYTAHTTQHVHGDIHFYIAASKLKLEVARDSSCRVWSGRYDWCIIRIHSTTAPNSFCVVWLVCYTECWHCTATPRLQI